MIGIRRGTADDLPRILEIYRAAREFMKRSGNPTQWGSVYPPEEIVKDDIALGLSHVLTEDGEVHGVFALCPGPDPTYASIDGAWLNDGAYAAIHRIATDGRIHGAVRAAADYARSMYGNVRADTHRDNKIMQKKLSECGFLRCGIIITHDGTPRIAYQTRNFEKNLTNQNDCVIISSVDKRL